MTSLTESKPRQSTNNEPRTLISLSEQQIEIGLVAINLLALIAGAIIQRTTGATAVVIGLAIVAYIAGGYFALRAGLDSLREGQIDVDLLMILAAVGAALIGSWPEGAMLLFLFSLSNVLQTYAMDRSRRAISKLMDLRPAQAIVEADGEEITLPVEQVSIGDVVIIRPGARIPVDGSVVSGTSSVDQASITGELVPVDKQIGDLVFAGTINQHGAMRVKTTKQAQDSTLAKIIQMVEQAQEDKAQTQSAIDRFEQYYALFVILATALYIIIPTVILGYEFQPIFYRAMVLLVVASPCALIISTPASILSGIANGARHGILFKGGAYLEQAATISAVMFDKTGTLTHGKPQVISIHNWGDTDDDTLVAACAAAESHSEHPIAAAILQEAETRGLSIPESSDFTYTPGQGITVIDEDDQRIYAGNIALLQQAGITLSDSQLEEIHRLEKTGYTVIVVVNGDSRGAIALADDIRSSAADTIAAMRQLGIKRTAMITGDNQRVAEQIAAKAGIDDVFAGLLPDEKVDQVVAYQAQYGQVMMVGDGVNDAPALARASISVAMGAAGTDVALETADIVLMADDLSKLPYLIELSRRARAIIWQNIAFSLLVIALLILASFGAFGPELPLPLGVLGHEGSTIIVVLNGLRLLRVKPTSSN